MLLRSRLVRENLEVDVSHRSSTKEAASPEAKQASASDQLALGLDASPIPRRQPEIAPASRIYVNRNLRLSTIKWVGFDMDYTLARYRQDAMDKLSIEATVKKMVERGRPESLLTAHFDATFPIRGLHVDRQLGNVLKMDRYRYVKHAFHGSRELTAEERKATYRGKPVLPGTKRFHWVDTLYALPEVEVFTGAVDHLEGLARARGEEPAIDYAALFDEVRQSIDAAHQDGSINGVIEKDFARYVERDPLLPETLHQLRASGKKLFLLTNSRAGYSDRMMRFLLDGALDALPDWKSYFDIVICFARKPSFFQETARPFVIMDEAHQPLRETDVLEPGQVHEGGCLGPLEKALGVTGDEILYVGDHIYGDVLRAKKESAWRTMMVVQEMESELRAHALAEPELKRLEGIADEAEELHDLLANPTLDAASRAAVHARLVALELAHDALEDSAEKAFHARWGSLFKVGPEVSSFGDQIERFACIYSERVSNLLRYANSHYFRGPLDRMPHER
jgi:HAD superfamily 5'-nucleotidase-like hydrolase